MTMTTEPVTFVHAAGCYGPRPRTERGKYGGVFQCCPACRRSLRAPEGTVPDEERLPHQWLEVSGPPADLDWPDLMAKAERRGIPVMRVDQRGDMYLIRSVKQLRDEWED